MGNHPSAKRVREIEAQEEYVNQRMKQADIQRLSRMQGGFFNPKDQKYNKRQLKGYLRQEYYGRRERDAYVLDRDLETSGTAIRWKR